MLVETLPDGLGRYRIVCTNLKNPSFPLLRHEVVLQIEMNLRERHVDPIAVGQQLSRVLKGYAVNVQITDAIPPTVGGKHRWIVSELQRPAR